MSNKIQYWKLTDQQKKLFRKRLIENKISILDIPVEPYEPIHGCYPLSCAQSEIFPFAHDEEEAAAYIMCNAIRIKKKIQMDLLEQAMQLMVEKYEVLRIYFVEKEGKFYQKVKESLTVKIEEIIMEEVSPEDRERHLMYKLSEDGRIPFSVFDFPFFRLSLYRLAKEECVLGINIHHFITDGISLQLITTDLLNTYADLEQRKQITYMPSEVEFIDYALWQNEWIQSDMLQSELSYWKDTLKGIKGCYSLIEDYKRPTVPLFDGGFYTCRVDEQLTARIRNYAFANHVSVFQLMLTVYMILVSRYRMDSDVALSTSVSGRLRKEIQHIAGFFAQGMVIRTFIEEERLFTEVLKDTAARIDMAFNNQIVPINLIGEALEEEEAENLGKIFDMFFTYHNYREPAAKIAFSPVDFGNRVAKGDLSFELTERENHFDITMEYNLALYKEETIHTFAEYYISMLSNCISSSLVPLKEVGILEKEKLLGIYHGFNNTKVPYDYKQSLYDLIEGQAKKTPDLDALLIDGRSFTYHDLIEDTGRLHSYLQQNGISSGLNIGICLEPSKELLIALLAVSKAGCAYVPLDPALPAKRALYIKKKAGLAAVLTDDQEGVPAEEGTCPCYYIKSDAEFWKTKVESKKAEASPTDNAYIMFTSGSTGNPKGVQISHENVVNFLLTMKEKLNFKERQSVISITTYAFDISVLELFLPLVCGGKVIMSSGMISANPARLKQFVQQYNPNYIQATPALWQTLLSDGFEGGSDIIALCGGDSMNKDLAEKLKGKFKQVWNMYGPTETTVWSLMHQLSEHDQEVYIGKPIGNTTVYLLDSNYLPVPPGVRGKLYIGGAGVSKGYLDNQEETDARFINNPFGDGKLFYTGDLAKCLADGTYEFCGRDDQQVKIRGYRIETKEIEICLNKHKDIEISVVVAATGENGDKVLTAYIQLKDLSGTRPMISELREFIREELPEYMIPSTYVFCERLPVTYNLKIDRKKLMEMELQTVSEENYEAPHNSLQTLLVSIWEQAMQKEKIGIQDDFYCMGGHSLSTIKIIELIYEKTSISIPLSWISRYPTIEKLAEQIGQQFGTALAGAVSQDGKQITAVHDRECLYELFDLTKVQTAYWVGRFSKGGLGGISTHIYREMTARNIKFEQFEEALNKVVIRHDMLRAIILENGQQKIMESVPVYHIKRYSYAKHSAKEAKDGLEKVRAEMSKQVFDPEKWPMFDVRICEMPGSIFQIHMSIDCLIGDARSFQIILKELAFCYLGREEELPALHISFRDYVVAVKQLFESDVYKKSQKYWLDKLDKISDKPLLPMVGNADLLYQPVFARKSLQIGKEQYQHIKELAKKHHVTKTVLLMSAFSQILALYSRKPKFTLNLTLFDRLMVHPDIPNVVGDFTTGTLLEVDLSGTGTFEEYSIQIQKQLMDNLEHRHYSSIDITREMLNKGLIQESFPVVFTSMLDVYEEEHFFEQYFMITDDEENLAHNITQTPHVWLDHQAMEWNGCLYINWDYVKDLFDVELIATMFVDYEKLLQELSKEETWNVKEPLAQKSNQYLYYNQLKPAMDFHEEGQYYDELMFSGFLKQVQKNNSKKAIITEESNITYEELERISDTVAIWILEKNTKSDCVGIVMEKGWEQVVAALAILKAGKAYVPVDAALPRKRIEIMIQTCGLDICLTTPLHTDKLSGLTDPVFLTKDLLSSQITEDQRLLLREIREQINELSKAYIIFTSGSTGEPKGVVINHKAAMNTIHDINSRFQVTDKDSVLALSSMSFDLSVYDVFGLLGVGGTIIIPEKHRLKDPAYWNALIVRNNITIWNSVPAFMNLYTEMEEEEQSGLKKLRLILLSGDWIPTDLPKKIWSRNKEVQLISLGGATECSIWSIFYPIKEVRDGQISIPYGKSLNGQQVYVLNEKLMLSPVGVVGGIYIGGKGLADGYWKDEVRTKEKFVYHPLTGQRLYHTGDIGKYDSDGNIIFLGRIDGQVKTNGHRVECGEIQAMIKEFPGTEDAVVMRSRKDSNVLLAFVKAGKHEEQGVILDPVERKIFKLQQKNIRKEAGMHEILLGAAFEKEDHITRKSYRHFLEDKISLHSFSSMITALSGDMLEGMLLPKYRYASAGSLYPVQVYLYIKENRVENVEGGYYYYNPQRNSLNLITKLQDTQTKYHVQENQPIEASSAFSIFLVADIDAIKPLYGNEKAKLYSILEAGLMTGLLEQEGLKNRIGFCQIGVFEFKKMSEHLFLSPSHLYLHMLTGGAIDEKMLRQVHSDTDTDEGVHTSEKGTNSTGYTKRLKEYLYGILPDYMVPQKIFKIEQVPLTSNGKVDYMYLGSMEVMEEDKEQVEEFTHISAEESTVLDIWKMVLEREHIGLQDNFFDIGGTSLKIVQVYKLLNQRLQQDFDVITLFQNPTIKAFASYIQKPKHNNPVLQKAAKRAQRRLDTKYAKYMCKE